MWLGKIRTCIVRILIPSIRCSRCRRLWLGPRQGVLHYRIEVEADIPSEDVFVLVSSDPG